MFMADVSNFCSCIFSFFFFIVSVNLLLENWLKIYVDLMDKRNVRNIRYTALTNVVTEERRVVPGNCILLNVIVKFVVG